MRGRVAFAVVALAITAAAVSSTESRRATAPGVATPVAGASPIPSGHAAPTPSGTVASSPLWRIDVPNVGGPFSSRLSPDARLVAVASVGQRTGVVIHDIRPPVAPSDVATLRELVRLDRAVYPVEWLPDSSGVLAYEPDLPSSRTGVLSLVGASGKRWSIATIDLAGTHGVRFSPDGRFAALWTNIRGGTLVVALDGTARYPFPADDTQHFAGWDTDGNLLFHLKTAHTLEARTIDSRVVYSIPLPEDLRELGATVPTFAQPRDVQVVSFDRGGCCQSSYHTARVLFDRKVHAFPAGLEDFRLTVGDGPWRGRELTMRREADAELIAFDPRSGATRMLGAKLPHGHSIYGISGDYFAWGRHIVELSTGRDREWTVQPPPESIIPLGSGRFVLWRDGTTELLDAAAWFAAPQLWSGELPLVADQSAIPPDWVRVHDDDGGFTLARPRAWSSYEGAARGAVLTSGGLLPSAMPGGPDVRVEIRVDISGPRGPSDFVDGMAHHGGRILERRTVQLPAGTAEFALVEEGTAYPTRTTSLNWTLRSPFLPERVVWIRAWPLDSGRRAEVEAVVATLRFVQPR
jgi:hypothetical protein